MFEFLSTIATGHWVAIYIIGMILTFTFFALFGKKLGFDYDVEKTYVNYDDYDSNGQAYTVFALFWPAVLFFGTLFGSLAILMLIGTIILEISWTKEKSQSDSLEPAGNPNGEMTS